MDRAAFEIMPFARRDDRRDRGAFEFETPALPTLRRGSRGSAVADLQRRLAGAGFSAGAADGIFGSLTDGAVRAFQRARGLGVDGIVGARTWGALLGTAPAPAPSLPAPAPAPAPAPGQAGDPQVTIPSGVLISANAVRVLQDILRSAGLTRATVTSGRRTSADQARIMYELIERNGVAYAHNLYGSNGDQVIDAYSAAQAAGQSSTGIKGAMEARIKQLGCQNVSHHCSDSYDVFDVAPSTISDSTAFRRALDAAVARGTIEMYLSPPEDPAFHIEIALAAGSGEFEFGLGFESEFGQRPCTPPARCELPIGGAAPPGHYSGPTRGGWRWYTPQHRDTRWGIARRTLTLLFAKQGRGTAPTASDVMSLSLAIRDHACNRHLRHRMMLPRFQDDRFTCGGSKYGAVFIPVRGFLS